MRAAIVVTLAMLVTRAAAADELQSYVVQPGDSCIGIALRVLGDRAAVAEIHRLNPELGPTPHTLVPGSVLKLPASKGGPDARLTRSHGDVKFRKPSTSDWDAARRGLELYRAYRVGAAEQSSEELTFADAGLLGMRERTIVVIYGPEKRLAKVVLATAELERGTLESRLGELDGKKVVVRTGSAEADLRDTNTVIASKPNGPSVVSNHRGRPVALRGRTRTRTAVEVPAGMGTRVFPGKAPEPPRPLPATPAWTTRSGPIIVDANGVAILRWQTVANAAEYRVAVRDRGGELVRAFEITAPSTEVTLPLRGAHTITVSAFDADGLEGVASPALAIDIVGLAFRSPQGRLPGPHATTPRTVAVGTTVVAPVGVACSVGGAWSGELVLDRTGAQSVRCRDSSGVESDAIAIEVVALSWAAPPPALPADEVSVTTVDDEPPSSRVELGAFTGYVTLAVRDPIALSTEIALRDGPVLGVRAGWYRTWYGVEAEAAAATLASETGGRGSVVGAALHGALRRDEGTASLRLLAGPVFVASIRDPNASALGVEWGAALQATIAGVDLRFDLRHGVASAGDGIGHLLQATLGASLDLPQ